MDLGFKVDLQKNNNWSILCLQFLGGGRASRMMDPAILIMQLCSIIFVKYSLLKPHVIQTCVLFQKKPLESSKNTGQKLSYSM